MSEQARMPGPPAPSSQGTGAAMCIWATTVPQEVAGGTGGGRRRNASSRTPAWSWLQAQELLSVCQALSPTGQQCPSPSKGHGSPASSVSTKRGHACAVPGALSLNICRTKKGGGAHRDVWF